MNSRTLWIVIAVIVVVLLGIWLIGRGSSTAPATDGQATTTVNVGTSGSGAAGTGGSQTGANGTGTTSDTGTAGDSQTGAGRVVEVSVTGADYAFTPSTITVEKGDRVRVTFRSMDTRHNFVIDELGVNSGVLNAGEQKTFEFVATKEGSFEYYCSVGNHRLMGMEGMITVRGPIQQ